MMKLIEKLKEEVFIFNKKLELIKLNPQDLDSIINMDNETVMKNIVDDDEDEGAEDESSRKAQDTLPMGVSTPVKSGIPMPTSI